MRGLIINRNLFQHFKSDTSGNIAMMFAGCTFMLFGGLALAIDGSRAHNTRSSLADMADAASLAGAYVATTDRANREDVVKKTLDAHLLNLPDGQTLGTPVIRFNDGSQELTVEVSSVVSTTFGRVLGKNKLPITAQSVTSYAIEDVQPVSLALVVDVSGSMSWASDDGRVKIDSLKNATNIMFDAIENAAPRRDILLTKVRSGMTAYNTEIMPDYTVNMSYGWDHVKSEVRGLAAEGGTSSTDAFKAGYDMLRNDGNKPENLRQFIVFMTDGANNDVADNALTEAFCTQAKLDGIEIYSVAFEAPQEGRDMLLTCASSDDGGEKGKKCKAKSDKKDVGNGKKKGDEKECEAEKQKYYFDAENAVEFEAAFKKIGEEIGNLNTRIVR